MKKKLFIIGFIFVSFIGLKAQNTFNGTIEYSVVDTDSLFHLYADFAPAKIYTNFYGNNVHQSFEGGFFKICEYVFLEKNTELYIIVDSFKVYTKVPLEKPFIYTITKESETIEILGYSCEKYKVIIKSDGNSDLENHIWITTSLKIPSSPLLEKYGSYLFYTELPYAVLKIETYSGLNYIATNISNTTPDKSLFKIPKGYKEDKNMFRKVEEKEKN